MNINLETSSPMVGTLLEGLCFINNELEAALEEVLRGGYVSPANKYNLKWMVFPASNKRIISEHEYPEELIVGVHIYESVITIKPNRAFRDDGTEQSSITSHAAFTCCAYQTRRGKWNMYFPELREHRSLGQFADRRIIVRYITSRLLNSFKVRAVTET